MRRPGGAGAGRQARRAAGGLSIPAALSVWLGVLRLGAACVVFLSHAGTQRISGGLGYQFTLWGEAAGGALIGSAA